MQEEAKSMQKKEESMQNSTKSDKMEVISKEQKEEQIRTKTKKKAFLDYWERSKGIISVACEKVDINRQTFYDWKESDPEFAKALEKVTEKRNLDVRDMLMGKIFIEKDGPSIRYYLDRKDPEFKPKTVTEIIAGERTIEDLLKDDEEEIKKQQEEYDANKKKTEDKNEPVADKQAVKDKKQEGGDSVVQSEHSAEVVSEEKNEKKSDTQSQTEGVK